VGPLSAEHPEWAKRIVRGAVWRWQVNAALFDTLEVPQASAAAA
jgi:hypothetical protein